MGGMGDGGDRTERGTPAEEDGKHVNVDRITYRAAMKTGIVAFRTDSKPEL